VFFSFIFETVENYLLTPIWQGSTMDKEGQGSNTKAFLTLLPRPPQKPLLIH
jgi:hypothetical protein